LVAKRGRGDGDGFSGTPDEVIGCADKAMYEVKRRGEKTA
jgi:GGDEF domain-containing protein